jgi:hypothetical protein
MATGTPAPPSSPLLVLLRAHIDALRDCTGAGHAGHALWCPECAHVLSSLLPIPPRVKGLLLG